MKVFLQTAAAAFILFAPSETKAQQAVQWTVGDGGNGHWYTVVPQDLSWSQARETSVALGGHLVTITTASENAFVGTLAPLVASSEFGAWGGGFQTDSACGPGCSWTWVSGEPWTYANWWVGEPNDFSGSESVLEIFVYQEANRWNDAPDSDGYRRRFAVEWSADCNNDGIVDYGQCRDGTLPDYDGNNVPDCCERGKPCAVGNYPVQWRAAEGGNGHWYQVSRGEGPISWQVARLQARNRGGDLAGISTPLELEFVFDRLVGRVEFWCGGNKEQGPWIGGRLESGIWQWVNGESWAFANWCGNGPCCPPEQYAQFNHCAPSYAPPTPTWNDHYGDTSGTSGPSSSCSYLIEWSADCNNDGIVDYGQILDGTLSDGNSNGVPDCCDGGGSCCVGDILADRVINGADLGALLFYWGPVTSSPTSRACDLDGDGVVNGADIGMLLTGWGNCP